MTEPVALYADLPSDARETFAILEHKVRSVALTFRGSYATSAKRDEAIRDLALIEQQARALRLRLKGVARQERGAA